MKSILVLLKLWGGKILTLIGQKTFLEIFPLVVFILFAIFTVNILFWFCACIQFIGCIQKPKPDAKE